MTKLKTLLLALISFLLITSVHANPTLLPDDTRYDQLLTLETGDDGGMPLTAVLELLALSVRLTPILEGVPDTTIEYHIPSPRPFRQMWDLVLSLQGLDYRLLDGDLVVVAPTDRLEQLANSIAAAQAEPELAAEPLVDVFISAPGKPDELARILADRFTDAAFVALGDMGQVLVSAPARHLIAIEDFAAAYAARYPQPEPEEEPVAAPERILAYYPVAGDMAELTSVLSTVTDAVILTLPDSNLVAVEGTVETQERIADLISRLKELQATTREQPARHYYNLSYAKPESVAEALRNAIEDANVVLEESTGTIIVGGKPSVINAAEDIISQLDVAPSQVTVQVRIQEITHESHERLGVNLLADFGLLSLTAVETGLSFLLNPMAAINSFNINAVLDALEQQNMSRNLQDAHVTLMSGKTGEFNSGGQITVVVETPGENGNQMQTVDYGTRIRVTPILTRDGRINLDIEAEVSGFEGELSGIKGFRLNSKSLNTQVIAEDGQALVLGGLLENTVQVTQSGVPFLSKIPLIGALFRSTTNTDLSSDLLLVVKVSVTDPGDHAEAPVFEALVVQDDGE